MVDRIVRFAGLALAGFLQTAALSAGDTAIFPDGFEGGATCAWTTTVSPVIPGGCLIGGVYYCSGDFDPVDSCQVCDPQGSQTAWSPVDEGGACDDGVACTQTDQCSGGLCFGVPNDLLCDDGLSCTQDYCDNTGCGAIADNGGCNPCEACDPTQDPLQNPTGCVPGPGPKC